MSSTIETIEFLNELLNSGALEVRSGSFTFSQIQEALKEKAAALKAQAEAAVAAYERWVDEQAQGYDDAKHMFVAGGSY